MRATTTRWLATSAISAGLLALATAPSVAAPGPAHGRLVLTSFLQADRTDVLRNEVLEFRFSAPLRKGSVDLRTLQVNEVIAGGVRPAQGARIVTGNLVRFDPTRTQSNYDASVAPNTWFLEGDRPEGLPGWTNFVVTVPVAAPGRRALRSRDGRPLERAFSSTFRTTNGCLDPVAGQPRFIGDHGTGVIGFDPPRHAATGLVDDDAAVVLEFSEPILTESLRPGETVLVTNLGTGAAVDGTVTPDAQAPSGRRFLFRPTGGFGGQGGAVQVALTTGVTDLAGNPLQRPVGPSALGTQ